MIDLIYIEEEIADHPRVVEICRRFPRATRVMCERYGEIFNRRAQNFRLQKRRPALILAKKFDRFVLPAPDGYGIGGERNFYFSHMLNCIYDCRYCFLQGMFQSAHYVLFVNYEDFMREIDEKIAEQPEARSHFFSGYDGDSLALDSVTGFAGAFIDFFEGRENALLELRTKSVAIGGLLARRPIPNCVVAFSMTPEPIAEALEHQVPALESRLAAMVQLARRGWKLGLRFDPLIYRHDYEALYSELFARVFARLPLESLHSVSLGAFRLPREVFKKMVRLYPEEKLLAAPLREENGLVSYRADLEEEMIDTCAAQLLSHIPREIFFPCTTDTGQQRETIESNR